MFAGLFTARVSCLLHSGVRGLATKVDKVLLSKLRKKTGIAFINCKKALERFDNDLDQAEKWLKEQAQQEGWARASKLQSRSMSSGLVAIVSDQQAATMIEVNCETDFVGRNKKFIELTTNLAQDCHQALLLRSEPRLALDKSVASLTAREGQTLADRVALEVGNIGENMAMRRAVHLKKEKAVLSAYVHASGPEIDTNSNCLLGKYGVILSLNQQAALQPNCEDSNEVLPLDEVGRALGQHIVGMNPTVVGCVESDEANEKKDEEDKLLFQEFLLDPSVTVAELLKSNGVTVDCFHRFACGEELPQDEE